jgi:hypothetical protein
MVLRGPYWLARYGCTCVGVEIDAPCLDACRSRAANLGADVDGKCKWHLLDITSMPPGTLGTDFAVVGLGTLLMLAHSRASIHKGSRV